MKRPRMGTAAIVFVCAPIATIPIAAIAWVTAGSYDKLWLVIWFWFIGISLVAAGLAWLLAWLVYKSSQAVKEAENAAPE